MSEIDLVVAPPPQPLFFEVTLDEGQRRVLDAARTRSLVVRGAPGSGKTTCALALAQSYAEEDGAVMLLAPDRRRADALTPVVQKILPTTVRPVRTPASFSYLVVNTWRTCRSDPLGPLELITGAQEDQRLEKLLAEENTPWAQSFSPHMRSLPSFRLELRNLFARCAEEGIDAHGLRSLARDISNQSWEQAADIYEALESDPERRVTHRDVMRSDSAHIQRIAAHLLTRWDEDAASVGVAVDPPRPSIVIVDDLQDCTPSTIELLAALAEQGTRIVAFSQPDVAVATYRGGVPLIDLRLVDRLGMDMTELREVHRGTGELRTLVSSIVGRIPQSGQVGHRKAQCAPGLPSGEDNIHVHIAASFSQLGALIARQLRSHHLHDDVPWEEQVVIVRSAAIAEDVRRQLRRASVPLAGASQAFTFSREPVTRILLEMLCLPGGENSSDEDTWRAQLAQRLLDSPFVSADHVEVRRLMRRLEAQSASHEPISLVALLDGEVAPSLEGISGQLARQLGRARNMWSAMTGLWRKRPRVGLWALWSSAKVEEQWRDEAIRQTADSPWYDDQLDAAIALFRVADIWEQRTPEGTAMTFAQELLASDVPTDTIAQTGIRPPGVEILTPTQAAGREWQVVCVAGVQDGQWPNLTLRDRLMHSGWITDIGSGDIDRAGAVPNFDEDARAERKRILDDEMRLFASAVSRSQRFLHIGAVRTDSAAPSVFVDIASSQVPGLRDEEVIPLEEVPPPLDLPGHVGMLRHIAAQGDKNEDSDLAVTLLALLAREGVYSADPSRWTGTGGISSTSDILGDHKARMSPSKLETARDCTLKWFFESSGASYSAGEAQRIGTLIHALAQRFPNGTEEELLLALEAEWGSLGIDSSTFEGRRAYDKAQKMITAFSQYAAQVSGKVETEVPLRAEIGDVIVSGSIDRLEHTDEGVRVVDLKTSAHPVTKKAAEDHPQLAAYQVALAANGQHVVRALLTFLGKGKPEERQQVGFDEETLQLWRDEIERVGKATRGPNVFATPSQHACQYCSFSRSCPAIDHGQRTIQ